MTALVELIKKRKEAMYDGIAKQWHEHMDQAYEAQSDSLKEQMQAARFRAEKAPIMDLCNKAEDACWAKPVDVTAWGEAERPRYVIGLLITEAAKANLVDVLSEAMISGAVILWRDGLPENMRFVPLRLGLICKRMIKVWGELPPYIEVTGTTGNRDSARYSIKPVWEL